ncbi:MAG TPA: hypothetical protein VLG38_00240 [Gammaproteobacteria bacterium]|nr:hypothetical protein [Gammaproteobacteria bacterium]
MAHKKHRHHDLKDPANVETQWIEKQNPHSTIPTEPPAPAKVKHANVKREERKLHEHDYEPNPSVARTKQSSTKREHFVQNSKDERGRSEH